MDEFSRSLGGREIQITTNSGTDITARIDSRRAHRQWGRSTKPGRSSAPPNIETAVSPVEGTAEDAAVIDGSIPFPGIGILNNPVRLEIRKERITAIDGGTEASALREGISGMRDPAAYRLAEIGVGFNHRSWLCGRMLEDEELMGFAHFSFGGNLSFGGEIASPFHRDMVFFRPAITVDGRTIMTGGVIKG